MDRQRVICLTRSFAALAIVGSVTIAKLIPNVNVKVHEEIKVVLDSNQLYDFLSLLMAISAWMNTEQPLDDPPLQTMFNLLCIKCSHITQENPPKVPKQIDPKLKTSEANLVSVNRKECVIYVNNELMVSFHQNLPLTGSEEEKRLILNMESFITNFYPVCFVCFGFDYTTTICINRYFMRITKLQEYMGVLEDWESLPPEDGTKRTLLRQSTNGEIISMEQFDLSIIFHKYV